jgi:hypothetical protein
MGGIGLLRKYLFVLLVVFSLLLAACGPEGKEPISGADSSARVYPIDAQFNNIDSRLENICGPGFTLFEKKEEVPILRSRVLV